jgi:hypothetical protein
MQQQELQIKQGELALKEKKLQIDASTKADELELKQQALEANMTRRFPVVFVVDPQLPGDVRTVTLSYTFFEVPGAVAPARPGQAATSGGRDERG